MRIIRLGFMLTKPFGGGSLSKLIANQLVLYLFEARYQTYLLFQIAL